ncbi:uncharacterized protein TNCV_1352761 [Trichonephila clavipes]|nr:uncharacterized protein TNCV_1352761 [Trichonephila clavipes]
MDEILTTARDLELEVNEDDIEELQEILNEEHQETHRNVSPSEQEEDERGPMPTSAIKDLLKKWADVRAMVNRVGTQTKLMSIGLEFWWQRFGIKKLAFRTRERRKILDFYGRTATQGEKEIFGRAVLRFNSASEKESVLLIEDQTDL